MRATRGDDSLKGLSILVLEDESIVAFAIKGYLKVAGAQSVKIANNLGQAQKLSPDSIDAAILDIRLPDGTSYDLAKQLISQNIAVVFHSGHTSEEDTSHFPGAVFCAKPSRPDKLAAALLASRQQIDAAQAQAGQTSLD